NSYSDVQRQWTASVAYDLPFGTGKAMLSRGGVVNAVFDGWQLASVIATRSGIPFTVTTSGNITNAGGATAQIESASGLSPPAGASTTGSISRPSPCSRNTPTATPDAIF